MIRITIHAPGGQEQVLEFQKTSIMIGRAAANDVCIDQGGVSRYHATITLEGDTLVVQDLGSTNGTLLGGKKIQTSNIATGDRLVLGDVAILVEHISDTPAAAPGAPDALPDVTGTLAPGMGAVPGISGQGFGMPTGSGSHEAVKDAAAPQIKRPTQSNLERQVPAETPPPRAGREDSLKALEALAIESSGSHKVVTEEGVSGQSLKDGVPAPAPNSVPTQQKLPLVSDSGSALPPVKAPEAKPDVQPVAKAPESTPAAKATPVAAAPAASPAPSGSSAPVSAPATTEQPEKISREASSNAFFWQALQSFLAPVWHYIVDDGVSEIMINGPSEIYIERKGKLVRVSEHFSGEQLQAAVLNIAQYVGRRVSEEEPYLDARLPDGSRVAVLMPPCSRKGASMAIRKFSKEKLTLERLISFGSLSEEMVEYLNAAVMLKRNIIISGGTSSGKTSLLNVVSGLIPDDERIITIEDSAELQLRQDHVLPMETKPADKKGRGLVTIRDLVKASLRMRPDRIVVGEIRGGEALDLLQAMNTGHSGSMATVHASSPHQALTRLETLSLFSGIEIPLRALREQVATAIEVVIQASRLPDHSRKVTHISEVCKLSDAGDYVVKDIFRFARESSENGKIIGKHVWTGQKSNMISEMELCGMTGALNIFKGTPPAEGVQFQSAGH